MIGRWSPELVAQDPLIQQEKVTRAGEGHALGHPRDLSQRVVVRVARQRSLVNAVVNGRIVV